MPKHKNYPKGFNPHYRPSLYNPKPKEYLDEKVEIRRGEIFNGCPISLEKSAPEHELVFERGYKHDDEYYNIVEYKIAKKENPQYSKQLEEYNEKLAAHKQELKDWKILKAKWDEEEKMERKDREIKTLEKLKKKYETNDLN